MVKRKFAPSTSLLELLLPFLEGSLKKSLEDYRAEENIDYNKTAHTAVSHEEVA
ncbi:MAG TPA: hypothetical protein VD969_00215 [Symbiobacteriaceae bacterium]|nr:hypothetical protein [Symbiobacteriaceae bacterium]